MPITLDDASFFSLYMSVKRSVSILNWFPPISNSEKVNNNNNNNNSKVA